ncbi:MAG: hypothetical protein IJ876_08490 [Elusimicrobiaceae bacterium]|nr:hypothetical protein [Elusimicrobiaceae bacterium]
MSELHKPARQSARTDYKYFLENNPDNTFELQLLHAFVIGYAKDDIRTTILLYFKAFVPTADRVVTDSLCQNFKIARKDPQKGMDFLYSKAYKLNASTRQKTFQKNTGIFPRI